MELPEWKMYSLELDNDGKDIGTYFQSQGYDIERVKLIEGKESLALNFYLPAKSVEDMIAESVTTKEKFLALSSHGITTISRMGFAKGRTG